MSTDALVPRAGDDAQLHVLCREPYAALPGKD